MCLLRALPLRQPISLTQAASCPTLAPAACIRSLVGVPSHPDTSCESNRSYITNQTENQTPFVCCICPCLCARPRPESSQPSFHLRVSDRIPSNSPNPSIVQSPDRSRDIANDRCSNVRKRLEQQPDLVTVWAIQPVLDAARPATSGKCFFRIKHLLFPTALPETLHNLTPLELCNSTQNLPYQISSDASLLKLTRTRSRYQDVAAIRHQ